MKSIFLSIFFMFTLSTLFSQIKISGTKTVITNEAPKEGTFVRKEVDVTKTITETTTPNIVIKNKIENSVVSNDKDGVKVALSPNAPTTNQFQVDTPNQIIIDMKEAKNVQDNNTTEKNNSINISGANINSNPTKVTTIDSKPATITKVEVPTTVVKEPVIVNTKPVTTSPQVIQVNTNPNAVVKPESSEVPKTVINTTPPTIVPVNSEPLKNTVEIKAPETNLTPTKIEVNPTTTNPSINNPISTNPVIDNPNTSNSKPTINTNPTPIRVVDPEPSATTVVPANPTEPVSKAPNTSAGSNESSFPERKANQWALGFNVGIPFVTGDVRSKAGFGTSINVQKALGHVVSLRFQSFFGQVYGQDWKLQTNDSNFKNYKSRVSDHSIQGVFTLNNINFYKRTPRAIFNLIAGAGFSTNYTWTNILDQNGNLYDYSGISAAIDRSDKKDILNSINDLKDKGYETSVVQNKLDAHIKNTDINPAIILGLGLGFKISKRIDINLEHRVSWHNADNLDAYTANGNSDWLQYTSLGLSFKLGKQEDAMWWMNPVYASYDDINDLKKKVNEGDLLTDKDQDGVADIFDKDLNTPEKVLVDSRGVASDLDKDGVPDYLDKEPFTPIGAKIDSDGVAMDTDRDGIADIFDLENNTPSGAQVDAKGRQIFSNGNGAYTPVTSFNNGYGVNNGSASFNTAPVTRGSELGVILFAENSRTIDKYYYPELYKVLSLTKSNPELVIVITGHTDVKATDNYNMQLSKDRAVAVYTMLTEIFKVPSSKLEIKYEGEQNPLIPGLPESNSTKYEPGHQLNRRVTLRIK